jgi:hypothetical protein
MSNRAYLVVPFERLGTRIGSRQALMCAAPEQAKAVAQQLARNLPGIAILERTIDPETGEDHDTVIAEIGAIPPDFPSGADWTLRLH